MRSEETNHDVGSVLRALARDMEARHEAPPALEAPMRAAYRRHRRKLQRQKSLMLAAIAASVVMLIAAGAMWTRRSPVPAPVEPVAAAPEPMVAAAPRQEAPIAVRSAPQTRRSRRPVAPRRTEIVTEFLPVAGGDLLEPPGRGRLVRVKLPRAALWSFGLPMNVDRSAEAVTADVLVGDDGLARAIRFVQ